MHKVRKGIKINKRRYYIFITAVFFITLSFVHSSMGANKTNNNPLSPLTKGEFKGDVAPLKKGESNKKNSAPSGMAYIPPGEFTMGSNDRWADEKPRHKRTLEGFYIDKYEVTNERYKGFINATKRIPPTHWNGTDHPKEISKHPVVYVSWYDADAYCKWEKKRLPTEAEWEKAARGADGRIYPWGDLFDPKFSNNPQAGSKGTEPVGSYEKGKSPYGLYDMSGNVWEWVDSWYGPHPGNNEPSEEYGKKYKVTKGGSWKDCLFYGCGISAPAFNRGFFAPETSNDSFGFRCAVSKE